MFLSALFKIINGGKRSAFFDESFRSCVFEGIVMICLGHFCQQQVSI